MAYIYEAKPQAAIERDEMFGITKNTKSSHTLTVPKDFFDMIDDLRLNCDWSKVGLKQPSFNQMVFYCVFKIWNEDIDTYRLRKKPKAD